jgi:hypothetical protein
MRTEAMVRPALVAAVAVMAAAHAADPAGSGPAAKTPVVTVQSIPGSTVPRVTLTAKAAERLGIEIGKVAEESVVRRQVVSGLVTLPMDRQGKPQPAGGGGESLAAAPAATPVGGGFADFGRVGAAPAPTAKPVTAPASAAAPAAASAPVAGEVWVLVTLSPREWDRLAKDKPARLQALPTRDKLGKEILARPTGMPPLEDAKRSMLSLYYTVPGKDHGLALATRMRVELELAGAADKQKVVPYGAVFYDARGAAWVYVNSGPLAFERQRIAVERIVGDLAVLSEGPPVGTPVVTVGAALLYGAEIFKK